MCALIFFCVAVYSHLQLHIQELENPPLDYQIAIASLQEEPWGWKERM